MVYFISNFKNNSSKLKTRLKHSLNHSRKIVTNLLNRGKPDLVFIEYAENAMFWRESLVNNNIPFLFHVHGYDVTSRVSDKYYKEELKKTFSDAKAVITASNYMKRIIILAGCSPEKIHVIPYGIVGRHESYQNEIKSKTQHPSVIFLGRLTAKKHPIALLQAFRLVKERVENAKLTIIGDGELRNEVQSAVMDLDLNDSVNMMGKLPQDRALSIVSSHWVYAQHSVTAFSGDQEGFAISIAEAAWLGLPVVSTIHNGIPEHVIDGETGYLVREFDYEDMAEKIIYLLNNPDEAKKFGENGSLRIKTNFSPELRYKRIINFINTITD